MFRSGIPIGKAFGIQLRLHYSWFLIFILITYVLTASYFPAIYPEWSLALKIGAGLLTSFLFFASVLVHELMHSIVAIKEGMHIRGITLFFLGGVSEMTEEPKTAGIEFRMAGAGPLSSLVLGGIFIGIFLALRSSNVVAYQFGAAVTYYLGYINIILGIFNLIPGFPLDGGRVLRSIIWKITNNLRSATRIASNIGRGIGYLFIFAGIYFVFGGTIYAFGGFVNGIWFVLIGWFLVSAATGSYRQLAIQEILKGHHASEIMSRDCFLIPGDMTVERLINEQILTSARRCFPVVTNDRVVGLITLHNIRTVPQEQRNMKTAHEIMTPIEKIKWVKQDEDLSTVLQILTESDINQVPVFEDEGKQLVGMVNRDNLLTFIDIRGGTRV
jgi:Zn-dependent protease/predicted transcriptional regulator